MEEQLITPETFKLAKEKGIRTVQENLQKIRNI
jgi:hypothetical protein